MQKEKSIDIDKMTSLSKKKSLIKGSIYIQASISPVVYIFPFMDSVIDS